MLLTLIPWLGQFSPTKLDSSCWEPGPVLRSGWQSKPRQEAQPWEGRMKVKGNVETEDNASVEVGTGRHLAKVTEFQREWTVGSSL